MMLVLNHCESADGVHSYANSKKTEAMLLLFSKQPRAPHDPCHIWQGKNPNAVTGNLLTAKKWSSLKLKVPVSNRSQELRYTGGNQLIEYRRGAERAGGKTQRHRKG